MEILPLSVRYRAIVDLLYSFTQAECYLNEFSTRGWTPALSGSHSDLSPEALGLVSALCVQASPWPRVIGTPPPLERLPEEALRGQLDEWQQKAALSALSEALSLIRGPARSGKTTLAVAVAHSFAAHSLQVVAPDGRREVILCCAPSDRAVDDLAAVMATLPTLRTVRVYSRSMEGADTIAIPLGEWSPSAEQTSTEDGPDYATRGARLDAPEVDQSMRGWALHTLVRSSASQSDEINEIEEFYALTGELPTPTSNPETRPANQPDQTKPKTKHRLSSNT